MSISTLFSGISANNTVEPLFSSTSTPSTAATGSTATTGTGGGTSTSLSSSTLLLKQLNALSTSNPAEFKAVTANIATQLQTQATQDGVQQGQALSTLAAQFQTASQTGSASGLEPHHHRHHGGGGSASSLLSLPLTALTASSTTPASAASGTTTATGSAAPSASAQAAAAYQAFSGQSLGAQVNSIISDALSQYSLTASTTSTTL